MSWEAPNRIDVIQRVHNSNPGLIHQYLSFCMECVRELNKDEKQRAESDPSYQPSLWGLNGKRGNRNDLSNDVVTRLNSNVPWGCSIVDIIGAADTDNPSVVWIDQTRRTAELGTVGLFVPVQGSDIVDRPEPIIPLPIPNPEVPLASNAIILKAIQELSAKLDAVTRRLDIIESKEIELDNQPVIDAVVSQAQSVLHGVTSEANRVIQSIEENKTACRSKGWF